MRAERIHSPPPAGRPAGIGWSAVAMLGLATVVVAWLVTLWRGSVAGAEVVVYCAQDQVLAEPILARFAGESGIRVLPVFDSEAVKTVGLVNRLLAERSYPVADLFWGNEEFRTRQLAQRGIWSAADGWTAFGARTRRLVVYAGPEAPERVPTGLAGLTNAAWRGRVSIAYPLFGTTATHLLALRQKWGASAFAAWAEALVANRPYVEEGNSHVVRRVARGEAWVGLTDSDDIAAAVREGLPVRALPLDDDMLRMPNTVAVVRDGPNPVAARRLRDFLLRSEVADALRAAGGLEPDPAEAAPGLEPDWSALLGDLDAGARHLETLFPR